jgi:hypothetical protein
MCSNSGFVCFCYIEPSKVYLMSCTSSDFLYLAFQKVPSGLVLNFRDLSYFDLDVFIIDAWAPESASHKVGVN